MKQQRGQALIVAILALLVLTLLGLALTSMSMVSMTVSTNEREASEALYVADSGIAHAVALLALQPLPSFDSVFQRRDGQPCTGDELAEAPDLPPGEMIPPAGRAFGPGRYRVSVCDDDAIERATRQPPTLPDSDASHDANGRVLIRSTGDGRNGASATVEATVARIELPGLLVDGKLRISGRLSLSGYAGAAHANGALELAGEPCAQRYWSATGDISGGGSSRGGPECARGAADVRPSQDPIPVPMVPPSSLRSRANYVLGADGSIRTPDGATVSLPGWSWDGSRRWSGGPNIPSGAYYVEGNVEIPSDPANPDGGLKILALTLIAEGWVDIQGAVSIMPALTGWPLYAVVAGSDLRLAGTANTTYAGVFYAGDQLDITGNPNLRGQVIAKNAGDLGYPPNASNPAANNLVRLQDGYVVVSGDATIDYSGGLLGSIALQGWRECRGYNPDNPCGVP